MSRYEFSLGVLNKLQIPPDADRATVDKMIHDAYPFGEREFYPYKMWLKAVRDFKRERAKKEEARMWLKATRAASDAMERRYPRLETPANG